MERLVFAYGSNMDEAQMRARCETARRTGCAALRGHALVFGGFSHRWNGAVASVRRARGAEVPGVLYVIDDRALRALDRFEGAPFAYERVERIVVDDAGRRRRAQVYVQPAEGFEASPPSVRYLAVIARAYQQFEFDRRRLVEAALAGAG
jgi:gamma-glutamylcyclotransferase (GGCT)/AIG2-like uncharacterized protein YtfP